MKFDWETFTYDEAWLRASVEDRSHRSRKKKVIQKFQ
jgi:hypothetical protein